MNAKSYHQWLNAAGCLAALGSLMIIGGCNNAPKEDPNRATVSGVVTFDGKPLPAGTILFASTQSNIAATVSIQDEGRYSTDRAPLGPNDVTIDTISIKAGNPAKYVPIPDKYGDPTKSGLAVDVKPGANENVNFELKR